MAKDKEVFICSIDGKTFKSKAGLAGHMRIRHNQKLSATTPAIKQTLKHRGRPRKSTSLQTIVKSKKRHYRRRSIELPSVSLSSTMRRESTLAMNYCYNCGTKLVSGGAFCYNCGVKQPIL